MDNQEYMQDVKMEIEFYANCNWFHKSDQEQNFSSTISKVQKRVTRHQQKEFNEEQRKIEHIKASSPPIFMGIRQNLDICIEPLCQQDHRVVQRQDLHLHTGHQLVKFQQLKDTFSDIQDLETFKAHQSIILGELDSVYLKIKNKFDEFRRELINQFQLYFDEHNAVQEILNAIREDNLSEIIQFQEQLPQLWRFKPWTGRYHFLQSQLDTLNEEVKSICYNIEKDLKLQGFTNQSIQSKIKDIHSLARLLNHIQLLSVLMGNELSKMQQQLIQEAIYTHHNLSCSSHSWIGLIREDLYIQLFFYQNKAVKISMNRFIAIGICRRNKIIEKNFNWDDNQGCGETYAIQSGIKYQPSKKFTQTMFLINDQDIIAWQYDPNRNLLQFRNVTSNSSYKIKIPKEEKEQLSACILLDAKYDNVELLNEDWLHKIVF